MRIVGSVSEKPTNALQVISQRLLLIPLPTPDGSRRLLPDESSDVLQPELPLDPRAAQALP